MSENFVLPPHIVESLMKVAREKRPDIALVKLMHDYLNLKLESIELKLKEFRKKYGMSFEEFKRACEEGSLGKDPYSYEVEKDYREWEGLITLKRYYEELRREWSTGM